MATKGDGNPDPYRRCHFSENISNVQERCSKTTDGSAFWCPTRGYAQNKDSKWGVCNDMCDKEHGKHDSNSILVKCYKP